MQFSQSKKIRAFETGSFLEILATTFRKMNHELKEKETWYSKYLREYRKHSAKKGIAVSDETKTAS
jgi:Mononegavirales RNA dependent RNA polymerase